MNSYLDVPSGRFQKQHIDKYALPQTLTDKECVHLDACTSSDSSPTDNQMINKECVECCDIL